MDNDLDIRVTVHPRSTEFPWDVICGEVYLADPKDSPFGRVGWFPAASYHVHASKWTQFKYVATHEDLQVCFLSEGVRTKFGKQYVRERAEDFVKWVQKKRQGQEVVR